MMPGGIRFTDPRVPSFRLEDDHTFLEERVREIVKFRLQNPKIYPPTEDGGKWFNFDDVAQEVILQNCSRIDNNPNYCLEGNGGLNVASASGPAADVRKCSKCGNPMIPRLSACCGTLAGYDCPVCGTSV